MQHKPPVLRMDDELSLNQLRKTIELLMQKLEEKLLQAGQPLDPSKKEEIIKDLLDSLLNKKLTLQNLQNGGFNKLFVNLTTATLLEKHFKNKIIDELMKKLKEINPDFDPKKIKKPEDLKKYFTEKQLKELLTPEVMKKLEAFNKEIYEIFKPLSDNPNLEKDLSAKKDDLYSNLFGIICSQIPGGHRIVVEHNYGNANNLPDWNPNHGDSQIDLTNRTDDTKFGDSLGLNAAAITNYLKADAYSDDLISEMINSLRFENSTPQNKPAGPAGTAY